MPRFNKKKWNKNITQKSHNCYSYMLDKVNKKYVKICKKYKKKTRKNCNFLKAQPGLYAGMDDVERREKYTCNLLNRRVLADNKNIFTTKNKCSKAYYKGMLFLHPKNTYHFYRQDDDGTWSHKDGLNNSTRRDSKRKFIHDPKKSNRKYNSTKKEKGVYYSKYCNTYCIPKSKRKKHFSAFKRNSTKKKRRKIKKKK